MALDGKGGDNLPAHVDSYNRFLGWVKWGTIAVVITTVAVLLVIAR